MFICCLTRFRIPGFAMAAIRKRKKCVALEHVTIVSFSLLGLWYPDRVGLCRCVLEWISSAFICCLKRFRVPGFAMAVIHRRTRCGLEQVTTVPFPLLLSLRFERVGMRRMVMAWVPCSLIAWFRASHNAWN